MKNTPCVQIQCEIFAGGGGGNRNEKTLKMLSFISSKEFVLNGSHLKFYNMEVFLDLPFRHVTYVTTHSPTRPSLYLRHSSFSIPFVVLPRSQLILQSFHRFTYVTAHSPTLSSLHLRHSSFSNPSFASPTSQALHLIHLASSP